MRDTLTVSPLLPKSVYTTSMLLSSPLSNFSSSSSHISRAACRRGFCAVYLKSGSIGILRWENVCLPYSPTTNSLPPSSAVSSSTFLITFWLYAPASPLSAVIMR